MRCDFSSLFVTVHLREAELAKAEEQLNKMTSSTEAKIDKLVLFLDVLSIFTLSFFLSFQIKIRYSGNWHRKPHSCKTFLNDCPNSVLLQLICLSCVGVELL